MRSAIEKRAVPFGRDRDPFSKALFAAAGRAESQLLSVLCKARPLIVIILPNSLGLDLGGRAVQISGQWSPRMRWRPGLRVPLLIFFAMALVSATLEPAAGAPLAFVAPIDDIRLTASSTQVGAIDLSSHFSASGDPVAYTALPY